MLTPQTLAPKLAKAIGLKVPLYLKREDLHPLGSHKGRSIPIMIQHYIKHGWRDFVISSSGNAALAAALYIDKLNNNKKSDIIHLTIYVGKNISSDKLKKIRSTNCDVQVVTNPKQTAFQIDKSSKAKNLRQSTDEIALLGYESLAKELSKIKKLSAIFIPTSSGTTAQGLHEAFKKIKLNPQIHIVQTSSCHPFADNSSQSLKTIALERSLASAIVDRVAHRKPQIQQLLIDSRGHIWVASNKEINNAIDLVKQTESIIISPNSALSIVSLIKASIKNQKLNGPVVCLLTGA